MLDLAFVRANLPLVQEKLALRSADAASMLANFEPLDRERRSAITELETLKASRNALSAQFGKLKREGADTTALSDEIAALKARSESLETAAAAADTKLRELLQTVPNLPSDTVPVGTDERGNAIIKTWGEPVELPNAKPHWEIGEALGILDFERAAKISGARFVVHFGSGARLERALANFMLDLHTREHGYVEVLPPTMVNSKSLFGTGQLPKFAEDLFHCAIPDLESGPRARDEVFEAVRQRGAASAEVRDTFQKSALYAQTAATFTDHWMIPTAEVPVTNIFRDETIDLSAGNISFCAYTPCYRAEAGSHGRDVRGMIRQHQFQKVELVKFTTPETSTAEHEALTSHAEAVLEKLGLPYRRMLLCTGDMGFAAAKTYDLEVWLPGQQTYREISSCSNFEAFQARRANIRFKPTGATKSEYVHTLNGSGLAVGRTYLAVLENYQQPDGSVRVPDALVPYMNGETLITPQRFGKAR